MTSQSSSFTSATSGTAILVKSGKSFTYVATAAADATLALQRSETGGNTWEVVISSDSSIATTTEQNTGKDALYRWACTRYESGTGTTTIKDATVEIAGTGTSPVATAKAYEYGDIAKRTVIECNNLSVTISDDAGVAQYGGVKVYDFPDGMILVKGAQVNGILTAGVTGTIIDNWDGDVALGTVTATTGSTLTSTEANILQSVSVSAGASDKLGVVDAVSVATALTESGARWLDGTSTAIDMYLNFLIDDDATHTAGTASFTGTIVFHWECLGDN